MRQHGSPSAACTVARGGALPADTDIDAVIKDLGLDQPTIDGVNSYYVSRAVASTVMV